LKKRKNTGFAEGEALFMGERGDENKRKRGGKFTDC